jgi:MoaA/NifB/PqqE/SkfB family radical SAM enzyme
MDLDLFRLSDYIRPESRIRVARETAMGSSGKSFHKVMSSAGMHIQSLPPAEFAGDSIDVYVNTVCNLKCKTCFLGEEYFQVAHHISLEDAEAIFRWAHAAGVRDVAFLGGEPSLHPRISDLLRAAREMGIPKNRFVTNGTRPFHRLLLSDAGRYIDIAYVSLDGPTPRSNDLVRGRGVFGQAVRAMALLKERSVPFIITASITPESHSEIGSLLELAETSGCQTLNIHWVSPTGRARDGDSSVTPDDWAALCRSVMSYKRKRQNFSIQCQPAYWWPGLQDMDPPIKLDACAVREHTNLQFMPDGSVYACGLLVDRPGLNGYRWDGESVTVREGPTELKICHAADGPGCPVRRDLVDDPLAEGAHHVPLCIYQRVHN